MLANESHAMHAYRESLADVVPLSREAERELARQWRAGDRKAGEKLVTACLPFVIAIALEYRRWGIPLEDVVQQGNLGLLRAASKFDLGKDCRLATYAAYWIRAEIRDYVVRGYRVVRLGTTKAERRALRFYRKTRESDPTALAAASGMTPEKAEWLLPLLAGRETSLEAKPDDHGALIERLAGALPSPEDAASAEEHRGRARVAVTEALRDAHGPRADDRARAADERRAAHLAGARREARRQQGARPANRGARLRQAEGEARGAARRRRVISLRT